MATADAMDVELNGGTDGSIELPEGGVAVNVTDDEQKAGSSTVVKRRNSLRDSLGDIEELPEGGSSEGSGETDINFERSVAALRHAEAGRDSVRHLGSWKEAYELQRENQLNVHDFYDSIRYQNLPWYTRDYYMHYFMTLPLYELLLIVAAFLSFLAFVFASLFALSHFLDKNVDSEASSLWYGWNLSVQTFLTIGYGRLGPQNSAADVIVFVESIVSCFVSALITGIMYLRFSRPHARFLFSKSICIQKSQGKPAMVMRFAPSRQGMKLINPEITVTLVRLEKTSEGDNFVRLFDLPVARVPILISAVYNVVHFLDDSSKLFKMWKLLYTAEVNGCSASKKKSSKIQYDNIRIHISLNGFDTTFQSEVRTEYFYSLADFKLNALFCDVVSPLQPKRMNGTIRRGISVELRLINDVRDADSESQVAEPAINYVLGQRRARASLRLSDTAEYSATRKLRRKSINVEKEIEVSRQQETTALRCCKVCGPSHHRFHKRASEYNVKPGCSWCGFCKHYSNLVSGIYVELNGSADRRDILDVSSWYWHLLGTSSWILCLLLGAAYAISCLIMAIIVSTIRDGIDNGSLSTNETLARQGTTPRFADAFFFSHQTISSIGYGTLLPGADWTHVWVYIMGFAGFVIISFLSGIIWAKYARPRPLMKFAEHAIVTTYNGHRVLMLRFAGLWRSHPIMSVKCRMTVMKSVGTGNTKLKAQVELKFSNGGSSSLFALPTTLIHYMDETSPLYGVDKSEFLDDNMFLIATVEGFDSALGQQVINSKVYRTDMVKFDCHYADILSIVTPQKRSKFPFIIADMTEFDTVHHDMPRLRQRQLMRAWFQLARGEIAVNTTEPEKSN
eukprot:g5130.t1